MSIAQQVVDELADFRGWRAGNPDFDLMDYVGCIATPDALFAFLALLAPDLVQHGGHYFLATHFSADTYDQWMKQLEDPIAVQKVMNHIHISTLFQQQQVSDAVAREAALRIAEAWSAIFRSKGLVGKAYGDAFEDAEVTLFQDEALLNV